MPHTYGAAAPTPFQPIERHRSRVPGSGFNFSKFSPQDLTRTFFFVRYLTNDVQTPVQNRSYLPQSATAFACILLPFKTTVHVTTDSVTLYNSRKPLICIECFRFSTKTKENVSIRIDFNSQRISWGHQHSHRSFV